MSKWADFVIVAVKYDTNNEYITHVRRYRDTGTTLDELEIRSRDAIVNAINKGVTYVTATKNQSTGLWHKGSAVNIYNDKYIRTSANTTKRDNLEGLPTF
ncbi:DUF3892 domain-containing protein [Wohlfahrtiimonas chitiniclastica]|uniref:DUF3892 domain-containing protein n=1 Tax=Wohlfahrtiimonas chitiniclastica TaxID=400946 RepID=UPI0007B402A2|nr:DUF3892 domain-containing protein [Wohlfahrtiimonas chitiniclastica]MBS7814769.1 DUF3892 domain-containing protein [Wohlfahrtiimonas chitiniclastica]WHR54744.1 DUF3892 domain-containing protein [Wohlfahrtiimonas chitiniclastica]